jgi:hypothetical protein
VLAGPDRDFYIAMNGGTDTVNAAVPPSPTARRWRRLIDTAADSPADYSADRSGRAVKPGEVLAVAPFALVALMSEG